MDIDQITGEGMLPKPPKLTAVTRCAPQKATNGLCATRSRLRRAPITARARRYDAHLDQSRIPHAHLSRKRSRIFLQNLHRRVLFPGPPPRACHSYLREPRSSTPSASARRAFWCTTTAPVTPPPLPRSAIKPPRHVCCLRLACYARLARRCRSAACESLPGAPPLCDGLRFPPSTEDPCHRLR